MHGFQLPIKNYSAHEIRCEFQVSMLHLNEMQIFLHNFSPEIKLLINGEAICSNFTSICSDQKERSGRSLIIGNCVPVRIFNALILISLKIHFFVA